MSFSHRRSITDKSLWRHLALRLAFKEPVL
jgi:hypothetical protein